jgi:hypothetical protein
VFRILLDPSNSALARAVMNANGSPTKVAGTVQDKDGNKVKIKTNTGETVSIELNIAFGVPS